MNSLSTYLKFAIKTTDEAGRILLSRFQKTDISVREMSKKLKTRNDLSSDRYIKRSIEKTYPHHSYLSEETGLKKKKSPFLWIVDPLDGTRNHQNANPFFSISLALWQNGEPLIGVIYAPVLQERYVSIRNKGAYIHQLREKRVRKAQVSSQKNLSQAYILVCEGGVMNKRKIAEIYQQFLPLCHDVRKLGSAAIELAWVGAGRADAYITPQISLWDIAAGIQFVNEAGGRILDFQLRPHIFLKILARKKINLIASNNSLILKKIVF